MARVVTAKRRRETPADRRKAASKTQAERDSAALGKLEYYIDAILDGHLQCPACRKKFEAKELQPSAVALLKARYDKLRPSLSAVEQTTKDPFNGLNREQLIEKLRVFVSDPAVARALGIPIPDPRPVENHPQTARKAG